MLKTLGVILLLFFSHLCYGQFISGRLIDADSKEPISHANVAYLNSAIGTITNEEGLFQLKSTEYDTLQFSFLGYQTERRSLNDLSTVMLNVIELEYVGYNLPGVVITDLTGEEIVKNALERIEQNFVREKYIEKGFYNEELIHKDGRLFSYGEASIESVKTGYRSKPRLRDVGKRKYRETAYFKKGFYEEFDEFLTDNEGNDYLFPSIFGGSTMSISLDILKSSLSFIMKEQVNDYIWEKDGIALDGDAFSYVIRFTPARDGAKYEGFIVIEDETFAIQSARFTVLRSYLDQYNLDKKDHAILEREHEVAYKSIPQGYILDRLNTTSTFFHPPSGDTLENELSFVVTDVDFDDIATEGKAISKFDDLGSIVPVEEDYWEGQTTILRSEKIQKKLDERARQLSVIEFQEGNWKKIKAKALEENKLIFIDVYTNWCRPCKEMDKFTFPDVNVAEAMNQDYIAHKIDLDVNRSHPIIKALNVSSLPTLIIATPWGQPLYHTIGFHNAEDLERVLKAAAYNIDVAEIKDALNEDYSDAVQLNAELLNQVASNNFLDPVYLIRNVLKKKKRYSNAELKFLIDWVVFFEDDYYSRYLLNNSDLFYQVADSTLVHDRMYDAGLERAMNKKMKYTNFLKFIDKKIPSQREYYRSLAGIDFYTYVQPNEEKRIESMLDHYSNFPEDDWNEMKSVLYTMAIGTNNPVHLNRITRLLDEAKDISISYEWKDLQSLILYKSGRQTEAFRLVDEIHKEALAQGIRYTSVLHELRN